MCARSEFPAARTPLADLHGLEQYVESRKRGDVGHWEGRTKLESTFAVAPFVSMGPGGRR